MTMGSDHGTNSSMEEIQISKFKATCLAVLDRVGRMRKPVLVTRFGKPVAQILPPPQSPAGEWLGAMRDDGEIRGDLIAPAADLAEWDVLR
ncbi:MAG: type II toxin-antitoxin system Phd/YefM family antitoxin [Boseongicola sp. SB0664_bin_43]|uniref:Type II toxin-antitoxin system Phd/YefM family antitoxin n=1 Tax=Boseongicola sp. SB0664_bin_43 TaxID=2604844 RepID=A0A6B0Y4U4_9RHOB|nr:type II toxin-antitoxin system Phd/YefM family antitoxin [Boseongicola sp. SB0664_bin_43]